MKPNPKNPRRQGPQGVKDLAESIKGNPAFFEARPILLSDRTGKLVIIGGERRSEAAEVLGLEEVPTILIPGLTEAQEDEIMVKDNTHSGVWDGKKLEAWKAADLKKWGIEDWAIPGAKGTSKEAREDDFDDKKDPAIRRCRKGDVWRLGEHRLMCGDCLDLGQLKTLMDGEKADMIFTDPPYGVNYADKNVFLNRIGKPMSTPNSIENDNLTPQEMNSFWLSAFNNLAEVTKERMAYYITGPSGENLLMLMLAIHNSPFSLKHMLVWDKNVHVLGNCDYNYKHEPILYGWKKKGTHHFYGGGKFKVSVWDINKPLKNDLHPTMKPIELVANCILDATQEGDSIIDVFGGSGTTLIAAEQTGRKCFMMEIDPHYCDVIMARWEKLSGNTAVKIS